MRTKQLTISLVIPFIFLLAFSFCKKKEEGPVVVVIDPCETKDCGFGNCMPDGSCQCSPGYSLDNMGKCSIAVEDKFQGSFAVTETCVITGTGQTFPNMYDASIVTGIDKTDLKVAIRGLCGPISSGGFVNAVFLNVVGDSLFMYPQNPDGDGTFVTGKGKINSAATRIDMNYKVYSSIGDDFICDQVTFVRK
jgi:hypothetical protein